MVRWKSKALALLLGLIASVQPAAWAQVVTEIGLSQQSALPAEAPKFTVSPVQPTSKPIGECSCPRGSECIQQPKVRFLTPTAGQRIPLGTAVNVSIEACYLHLLGGIGPGTTSTQVNCPGFTRTTAERNFQFVPPQAGTCTLNVQGIASGTITGGEAGPGAKRTGPTASLQIEIFRVAPQVSLTSPANNAIFEAGATLTATATASDSDGTISRVEFEVRNTQTGAVWFSANDTSAPYSVTAPNLSVGDFTVRARAVDNEGKSSVDTRAIKVNPVDTPPVVSITAPTTTVFLAPANLNFEASASDPGGAVQRVEFQLKNLDTNQNHNSSTDSLAPYTHSATSLLQGRYRLTVRAVDNTGRVGETSREYTVRQNQLPTVAWVVPAADQTLVGPVSLQLVATANDSDGQIASVEFVRGVPGSAGVVIGRGVLSTSGRYEFNWNNISIGEYSVFVRATDNSQGVRESGARIVRVRANTPPDISMARMVKPMAPPIESYPLDQSSRIYHANVFESNQIVELEASFRDVDSNLSRVEFYLNAKAPENLLASVQPNEEGIGSGRYRAVAEVALTQGRVSPNMQNIFAIAYDSAGESVETRPRSPVAIRLPGEESRPCTGQGAGCADLGQPHVMPGVLQAEHYDLGGAGLGYFEVDPFAPLTFNGVNLGSMNPRGDDVDLANCNGETSSPACLVGKWRLGEWITWSVHFPRASQIRPRWCFKDLSQLPQANSLAGLDTSELIEEFTIRFERTDTPTPEIVEQRVRIPALASVPTESIQATGGLSCDILSPVTESTPTFEFPAGYRGRFSIVGSSRDEGFRWRALDWILLQDVAQVENGARVEITSPVAGSSHQFPVTQPIAVRADVNSLSTVAGVEFRARPVGAAGPDVRIGEVDTQPPYSTSWVPSSAGRYALFARMYLAGYSGYWDSSIVEVAVAVPPSNQPPQVQLLAPAAGTTAPGATLSLRASATDPDGAVARVDFLIRRNGVALGTPITAVADPAIPGQWTASWTVPSDGAYEVQARATDAGNPAATGLSSSVAVTAQVVPGLAHETPVAVPQSVAPASDGVGATAGVFRVDESGAATYSIALATVPGRAGVAPEMALSYSSQAGMGALGRGWSISGASAITRCRQTAESGDTDAAASGSPPLSFDGSDRYCLDGQRLILVDGSYDPATASMEFRTEIDSFARVRAFNTDNANGPNYFVVQAKDGTTSWYGDRIAASGLPFLPTNFTAVMRSDAALRRNQGNGQTPGANEPVLAFALARRMDSFGNYIDFHYTTDQAQGEQLLARVEYTGKTRLNGQSGGEGATFAGLSFNYEVLPAGQQRGGWQAGMRATVTRRLASVDSIASLSQNHIIRQYRLSYALLRRGSEEEVLKSIKECSSAAADAVCYRPTSFDWSQASLTLDDFSSPNLVNYTREDVKAHQIGDVDGDGLLDLVWFDNRTATSGHCPQGLPWQTQRIWTGFGTIPSSGAGAFKFDLAVGSQHHACSLRSYVDLPGAWFLHDFNGDGRDDLWLADRQPGSTETLSWQVYASQGRQSGQQVFNQHQNLLAACPPGAPDAPGCLPVNRGSELLLQLADINGDGLQDAVYGSPLASGNSQHHNQLRIKLMERAETGYRFSQAYAVELPLTGDFADCSTAGVATVSTAEQPRLKECRLRFEDASSRWGRSPSPVDLDGDGRADLILMVEKVYEEPCQNCTPVQTGGDLPSEAPASFWIPSSATQLQRLSDAASTRVTGSVQTRSEFYHLAANVRAVDAAQRTIQLGPYDRWVSGLREPSGSEIRYATNPRPADFNGDGLTDLIWSVPGATEEVSITINTGRGFLPAVSQVDVFAPDHLRIQDIDGDGRTDLLFPSRAGSGAVWQMRRGLADGSVSSQVQTLPLYQGAAGTGSGLLQFNPNDGVFFFADFDGDGRTDYLDAPLATGGRTARMLRSSAAGVDGAGRYKSVGQISRITNGYGAVTDITYQPLTNGAVYLREPGSRANSADIGRGSPVMDLLGGMYVVSKVASDAPGLGAAASRQSQLYYQYRGGRMQSGGRGILGFREIRTLDANFDAASGSQQHVVSITEYGLVDPFDPSVTEGGVRYGFPYIGMPRESRQYRVNSGIPDALRRCLESGPEQQNNNCFNAGGHVASANPHFAEPNGTLLSYARNHLNHAVTAIGLDGGQSVFPYVQASLEAKGNPEHAGAGIATLSETLSHFDYIGTWGDLHRSVVGTASGAEYSNLADLRLEAVSRLGITDASLSCAGAADCVSSVRTVNTWVASSQPAAANDRDYWRLGRLQKSTVTHWRKGVHGEPDSSLTRESRFEYELTSAARTGALSVERVAGLTDASNATAADGSASELRTVRLRDAYGNVTDTFVCSGDVSAQDCTNPAKVLQRPAGQSDIPLTRVHRHTRTVFDGSGRYPSESQAPYYDGTSDGALLALETVQQRDALGNVMQTRRLNGGSATATYGPLGRQQTSEDSTGSKSVSEFHWCAGGSDNTQVAACPSDIGAVFRQTAYSYGGTRSVTYFDRLGREVFALSESFNRYDNTAANDWVGVCKTYDRRGRTVAVSEPFFVGNVAFADLRPELSTPVACGSRASTRTTYDVLDRAVTILLPEHSGTTTAMSEMEYSGLQTSTFTRISRATSPFAAPTVVTLSEIKQHDASGQVLSVTDAEGFEARYAHDAAGNLVALKRNAGRGDIVSSIRYDALGRKISQTDPDAGTASYAYNAAGELICSQDARGYATISDFDALGRSWRSRTVRSSCASTTTAATTPSNADASVLPGATAGDHSSVDLTVFDLAANGVGQIESTLRRHRVGSTYAGYRGQAADQGEFQQTSTYDGFGRPSVVTTRFREPNLGGTGLIERSFTQSTTYDGLGRVATTQDATGGVVENMYSAHGFLRRVRDAGQPSLVFWELLETDVRGQTTLDRRHGKVELTQKREYNEVTGRLARIVTGTWSNNQIHSAVQNLSYVFDAQGNLLSRKDERANGREEVFVYDRLNRLIEARLNGASPSPADGLPTLTLSYDKLGNICSKNGVGYTYAGRSGCGLNGLSGGGSNSGASPHAVTARGAQAYQYDAAGNMTRTTGHNAGPGFTNAVRDVRFDGAGNADRLSISNQSTSFWYAGGGRYLRLDESSDAPAKLTRYLGGVEWILRSGGAEERRRSIGGFLLLTESVTAQQPTPTRKYRYLLTDHLGSTDTLVDENGAVVERMSFDAHGSRRAAASGTGLWASLLPAVAPTDFNPQVNAETTRGFTGHEHVDRMGLIHMNGRLYDPLLGRMLSPDPIVQEPYNAQNLNRYSYVLNNPLSYTDPSGLSFVKKYWRQIVAIAISVFVPVLAPTFAASFWGAVAIGFTSGVVATGSLEGGLWGAFGAGIFHGIGIGFESVGAGNGANFDGVFNTNLTGPQFAGQVLSHATAGGVISVMQGGKFGHGFASAGISKAAGPATANAPNDFVRAGVHALIGGTASAASGGKFANGAITAAMAFAFNEAASALRAGRTRSLAGEAGLGGSEDFAGGWFSGDHEYNMANKVCDISERCTLSRVYETSSTVLPAPANYLHATPDPNVTVWQIRSRVMFGTTLGKVYVSRDPSNFSHTNFTTEDHAARYGAVHRTVFQRDGAIWIHTRGVGSGMMPAINNILGRLEFDMLDERLRNAFN